MKKNTRKMTLKEQRAKEDEAKKMWLAQCDPHSNLDMFFDWYECSVFVSARCFSGAIVEVQVGWDSKGAYVWNGYPYRFQESETRSNGTLVLDMNP
jgi:hypothetical protein